MIGFGVRSVGWVVAVCVLSAGVLSGCVVPPRDKKPVDADTAFAANAAGVLAQPFKDWVDLPFPAKTQTTYEVVATTHQDIVKASADRSASMYRWELNLAPAKVGKVKFSWWVPEALSTANIADKNLDDAPARLVLAFDGDRREFSAMNAALSELTLALTGEPMPYATLMYVWCERCTTDRVVVHGRTDRIRYIELAAQPGRTLAWQAHERDMAKDYQWAFAEPMGALVSVGLMTDSDNTQTTTVAYYGPVTLIPR